MAEWAITILILLFGTSTIAQPFVIPTASMHNTLLTGDHLIVDKLAYAPSDAFSKHLLPYEDVKRGDIIVFRHPTLITVDYVKRCIGVPGDHLKLVDKRVFINGQPLDEPYVIHQDDSLFYRDNFPQGQPEYIEDPKMAARANEMLHDDVVNGELVIPPGILFRHGRQSRQFARQPLLGLGAARQHRRQAADHFLVLRCAHRRSGRLQPASFCRPGHALLQQDSLEPHVEADPRLSRLPAEPDAAIQRITTA